MSTDSTGYVVFRVGSAEYALPVATVSSIIRFEATTPVPRSPEAVLGVINLRGRVIPVVDISRRFTGTPFSTSGTARIIVAEGAVGPVGLAVDAAHEVAEFSADAVKPVPDGALVPETARAFVGVVEREGSLVVLLDLDEAIPRAQYATALGGDAAGGDPDA